MGPAIAYNTKVGCARNCRGRSLLAIRMLLPKVGRTSELHVENIPDIRTATILSLDVAKIKDTDEFPDRRLLLRQVGGGASPG